jgi:hypothetical protein
MAKLPYTFTIYPDQPNPKQVTASCVEIGLLLKHRADGDLTIRNDKKYIWDSWTNSSVSKAAVREVTGGVHEMIEDMFRKNKQTNKKDEQIMNDLRKSAEMALEALKEIEWSNNSEWQRYRASAAKRDLNAVLEQERGKATPMSAHEFDSWIVKAWGECQEKAWREGK